MSNDLSQLMKKAQEMQAKMAEAQKRLDDIEVVGEAGAGLVKIRLSAKGEAKSVAIDKSAVDPAETEVLEDLILAALNDAKRKADAAQHKVLSEATSGAGLPPGIDFPFGVKS